MTTRGYGIEVEFTGVTRLTVVQALEDFFQAKAVPFEGSVNDFPYYYYKINDQEGLTWTVMRDRSIRSEFYSWNKPEGYEGILFQENTNHIVTEDLDEFKVELVSPVLTLDSMPVLFSILNLIKGLGGIVNDTTGIHVHIDVPDTAFELLDLLKRFSLFQDEATTLFNTEKQRLENYCKLFPLEAVERFITYTPKGVDFTKEDVLGVYLSQLRQGVTEETPRPERYYALNLARALTHKTVEYRFFNSSLEVDDLLSILRWVIGFSYGEESEEMQKLMLIEQTIIEPLVS